MGSPRGLAARRHDGAPTLAAVACSGFRNFRAMSGDAYGGKYGEQQWSEYKLDGEQYFWKSSFKAWTLTVLVVIDIVIVMVYYIRSVDALRRLSRPVYYMHPAQVRGRLRPNAYG